MGLYIGNATNYTIHKRLCAMLHLLHFTGKHHGRNITIAAVSSNFYWKQMTLDIRTYVQNCCCQKEVHGCE